MMTDTNSLRAAAERLLKRWHTVGLSVVISEDVKDICDAYIAEHPADDDVPVAVEWLESLSRSGGDMSFLRVRLCDDGFHLMSPCNTVGEGIEGLTDFVSPNVATRGDVRRLCKALGVELK